jgi:serine/threonine-protein kinase
MPPDRSSKPLKRTVRIGKYEVVRHIATGGMGAVYLARDTELDREVALKVLPPTMAAKPAMLERFKREARHAARLRHENIVTIYEQDEVGGTHFLALEFIDGVDLGEYISRKSRLDPEEARLITIQAARALDHAHRQGIVHRDIKPSNFLLTRPAGGLVVKLTDMGLAREVDDDEFRVTKAGTTVGTVDYMAPEQARNSGAADTRSDLYSLGCTLFHMLAGQPPFPEGSLTERIYKHVETEPPDIRSLNPTVPEPLCYVLERLLAKRPEDRYQTPADLLQDLVHPDAIPVGTRPTEVLAGLADGSAEQKPIKTAKRPSRGDLPERRSAPYRPGGLRRRRDDPPDTDTYPAATTDVLVTRRELWPWLAGGAATALALGLGGYFAYSAYERRTASRDNLER